MLTYADEPRARRRHLANSVAPADHKVGHQTAGPSMQPASKVLDYLRNREPVCEARQHTYVGIRTQEYVSTRSNTYLRNREPAGEAATLQLFGRFLEDIGDTRVQVVYKAQRVA